MARGKDDDTLRLKRERAGRYVTADGRFAVEGDAAGAWYMIDSERFDGLGLPLVRGPFPTLDAAREAVAGALATADEAPGTKGAAAGSIAPARKLKAVPRSPDAAAGTGSRTAGPSKGRSTAAPGVQADEPRGRPRLRALEQAPASEPTPRPAARSGAKPPRPATSTRPAAGTDTLDDQPAWMGRLTPEQRAEARRLLSLLERAGVDDPGLVRREIEAGLPEVVRALLARIVQRDAIDPWAAGAKSIEALTATSTTSKGAGRDPRVRAAKAAAGRLLARSSADDLGLLAWLVALQTSVRIFEALGEEGRDAGQGLRGWRLVELGQGRAATGRTLALDEPDLLRE